MAAARPRILHPSPLSNSSAQKPGGNTCPTVLHAGRDLASHSIQPLALGPGTCGATALDRFSMGQISAGRPPLSDLICHNRPGKGTHQNHMLSSSDCEQHTPQRVCVLFGLATDAPPAICCGLSKSADPTQLECCEQHSTAHQHHQSVQRSLFPREASPLPHHQP